MNYKIVIKNWIKIKSNLMHMFKKWNKILIFVNNLCNNLEINKEI